MNVTIYVTILEALHIWSQFTILHSSSNPEILSRITIKIKESTKSMYSFLGSIVSPLELY